MKRRRIILTLIGVLLVFGVFVPVIHHYQLRSVTEAYIAELKTKGEPMDLGQVLPPLVAPEQNGADTLRKVAALFKADRSLLVTNSYYCMRMVAPGKAMVCWQQPAAYDYNVTNSWEEVEAALAQNAESFELLQQMIEKSAFDFQIHYEKGITDLNFTNLLLPEAKGATLRLRVALLDDMRRGKSELAVKDLRAMLAITKAMSAQRLVISELVRDAISELAVGATWEILQSTNITDGQLASLQHDWVELEFFRSMENALELERAADFIKIQKWRSSNAELGRFVNSWWVTLGTQTNLSSLGQLSMHSRIFRWRYWWSYPDELRALKGTQFLLEAVRSAQTNQSLLAVQEELEAKVQKLSIPPDTINYFGSSDPRKVDLRYLLSASVPSLSRAFKRTLRVEVAKELIVAAIGVERYHLKHGKYPDALALLVPDILAEVPQDPMDGKPLRYQAKADGTVLLYSIGDDGKDNGGDATRVDDSKSFDWRNTRDWVWPQPATAQEIQYFYDNPPK